MKGRTDHAYPGDDQEGWDETVLVWNATVARIPAARVRPDSAADATGVADGPAMSYREARGGAPRPQTFSPKKQERP